MNRKTILLVVCLLTFDDCFSQSVNLDRLKQQLNRHAADDTTKVALLSEMSLQSQEFSFSESLAYAKQALKIAEQLSYTKGIARARNHMAYCFRILGDGELAIEQALQAASIAEAEQLPDILIESFRLLCVTYSDQGDIEKAELYVNKAEKLCLQTNRKETLPRIYNAAGFIQSQKKTNNRYDTSLLLYNKALSIAKANNSDPYVVPIILSNIGSIYKRTDRIQMSIPFYLQSLDLANKCENKFAKAVTLAQLANVMINRKKFDKAEQYMKESTQLAEQLDLKIVLKHNYLTMIDLNMQQGKFWEAHAYMKKRYELRDSIQNEKKARQILEMETRYETEKKEKTIQLLEQEKRIQIIWIVGSLLLIVALIFIYRLQQLRARKASLLLDTQKILNEKLKETDLLKSRFFANISHEFRTPLSLILAPIEDKLLSPSFPEADKDDLRLVRRNATRLLDLINQLLDLSKLEMGKMKLRIQSGNLEEFVKVLSASFDSFAETRKISFAKSINVQSTDAWFDKDKLEKIISNVLFNAFKFTPPGGSVNLVIDHHNNELLIKVEDTGKGISEEDMPHVFSLFYQSKNVADNGHPGTGLGLSLVNELVKLHNGSIELTSRLNLGTTICIKLTTKKESFLHEEIELNESSQNHTAYNLEPSYTNSQMGIEETFTDVILIIEDNPELRSYIGKSFKDQFRIITAQDGEEGLQLAFSHIPDLIISDVMMPKMDGLELTEKLKTDERTSHIPVILLTAKSDEESRIEGFRIGVDDYLSKPFSTEELHIRVTNLIKLRKKLTAKYRENITAPMPTAHLPSLDEKFFLNLKTTIEKHIGESSFSVEELSEEMCLSRTQLFRKVKALLEMSPNELINDIRLQRAAELIKAKSDTLTQISYSVGFNEQSYFAKRFKKKFGVTPSEYQSSEQ